jgi:predicted nucleotidyltransferase
LFDREPGRSLFDPDGLLSDLREYFKTDFDLVTKKALPPRPINELQTFKAAQHQLIIETV